MTFTDFISKWDGRGIDFDGYYGDQCMDLMHQYCVDVLGLSDGRILAAPSAKDVYLNFDNIFGKEYFDKIPNTPTGVPQAGDIMFWGTGIGQYGHVAMFQKGDASKFTSFDQNFPTGSKSHLQSHDYTGVLGWLRPKKTAPSESSALTECLSQHVKLVTEAGQLKDTITQLKTVVDNLNKTISDKEDIIKQRDIELSTVKSEVLSLKTQLETTQGQADKVLELMKERDQAINDRTVCLNAQESMNKSIAQLKSNSKDYTTAGARILLSELLKAVIDRRW